MEDETSPEIGPEGEFADAAEDTDDTDDTDEFDGETTADLDGDAESESGATDETEPQFAPHEPVEPVRQEVSPEAAEADAQIAELEEQITLVDAAMSHLDADDLEAAEAAVGQLDQGNDPTLFAAATTAEAPDTAAPVATP